MSRRVRYVGGGGRFRGRGLRRRGDSLPFQRRLRFEPLEQRRLLAITVNTLVDEQDGSIVDGDVSLRDAIAVAASGETIGFSVTGTINLTGLGDLVINKNLTINGPGAGLLTIRAFDPSAAVADGRRVFLIDDGNAASVKNISISGLTLTGADMNGAGGAIRNAAENLSITGCTISGNHATIGGGIHSNAGPLSISSSTISGNTSGNGAGIYTQGGSLSVTASTISGNAAAGGASGGGILTNSATATIDSSTISGNSANYGGGISHGSPGFLMTITNSTISGNSARRDGGGVGAFFSNVTIRHSTITLNQADSDSNGTGNGGGVFVTSTLSNLTLDHTIVAGNLRQASTRSDVFGAVVASSAFNLVGVDTGLTGISHGTNGNQIGTSGSPINPLLGALTDNVGPTFTHALLAGSPAIDAGNAAFSPPPTNDQRGAPFVRVFDGDGSGGARIDIGAYERQTLADSNFVVDTLADENDGNYSAGDRSLREVIGLANSSIGADTITFAASLTSGGPATILLFHGELAITDELAINGPGASLLTIDASGNDPTPDSKYDDFDESNDGDGSCVFNIDDGNSGSLLEVSISGLTLTGADAPLSGGGVRSRENLTLANSTVSGNLAQDGGGIANLSGNLTVIASSISGNFVASYGGGIYTNLGSLTIAQSTISGNGAFLTPFGGFGSGIYSKSTTTTIDSSTISGNLGAFAGGISHSGAGSQMTITNSTISGNSSARSGGGVSVKVTSTGNLTVRHSTITGNRANSSTATGGGVFVNTGQLTIDHTIVAGNFAEGGTTPNDIGAPGFFAIYSMIGIGAEFFGPLDDNGGPTKTHALLLGSPAIDAGDPNFDPADPDGDPLTDDAVAFDQRGAPHPRVANGDGTGGARIDIGAFELLPSGALPTAIGDYNHNNVVDAADYTLWRNTLGQAGLTPYNGADGNGDGMITRLDYDVWTSHFGQTVPAAGVALVDEFSPGGDGPSLMDAMSSVVATPIGEIAPPPAPPRSGEGGDPVDAMHRAVLPPWPVVGRRVSGTKTLTPSPSPTGRGELLHARDAALLALFVRRRVGEPFNPHRGDEFVIDRESDDVGSEAEIKLCDAAFALPTSAV